MSVPKSVTKVSKDGSYKFVSNVDAVEYTMKELIRGALRDTGKFVIKQFRIEFYNHFKKQTGNAGRGAAYWVRSRDMDLQVGLGRKGIGWWAMLQEIGTSKQSRLSLLRNTVDSNTAKIQEIQAQYLSELSNENPSLNGLHEGEYEDEE